jgi:uncharacterized protein (DUF1330 family)
VPQWSDAAAASLVRELGVHGMGGINPDASQLLGLLRPDGEGPLQLVNLLAFRARARYPEDHELAKAGLSGAAAYGLYGAIALDHVVRRGGALTLYNDVLGVLVGQSATWDQVTVIQYPDRDAFVDMIRDPAFQAGLVHRDAGLAEAVVLVSRPLLAG